MEEAHGPSPPLRHHEMPPNVAEAGRMPPLPAVHQRGLTESETPQSTSGQTTVSASFGAMQAGKHDVVEERLLVWKNTYKSLFSYFENLCEGLSREAEAFRKAGRILNVETIASRRGDAQSTIHTFGNDSQTLVRRFRSLLKVVYLVESGDAAE